MADLKCHIVTFNCGRQAVDVEYFASSLFSSFPSATLPPDLIVLALQELAPLAQSFVGGARLEPFFANLKASVSLATSWKFDHGAVWEHVLSQNLGMTGVMVFARQGFKETIRWIEDAGVGVGVQQMGNKGAVGVRMGLEAEKGDEMVVTFVAAHLAPHESEWKRRNLDWRTICEGLVFEPATADVELEQSSPQKASSSEEEAEPLLQQSSDSARGTRPATALHTLFSPPSYVFFAGDLNYRTSDTKPAPDDSSAWPKSTFPPSNDLLANDQLTRERQNNNTLHHLAEAPITFPPTYKYSSAAQQRAASHAKSAQAAHLTPEDKLALISSRDSPEEDQEIWAKHRFPSWCDRILYLATAPPKVRSYTALPVQPTSDHRPVVLSCSIPRRPLSKQQAVQSPFEIKSNWKQARSVASQLEVLVGAGAYLTCTRVGQTVLLSIVVAVVIGVAAANYAQTT